MLKSIGATILLIALSAQTSSQKCYGLAMEGGGMKGAYEAGALMALTEFLPPEETSYSIITGISIGAVNGCMGVGFPVGQERQMAEHIYKFWNEFEGSQEFITNFFGGKYFGPYIGYRYHTSLYKSGNELKTIRKWAGDTIRRNLTVAATNYNTGVFTSFSQDIGMERLTKACYASSAFPIYLPPVQMDGEWWADGAVVSNIDGLDAIEKCRELGYKDQDIVIDYLFDETIKFSPQRVNNTKQVRLRLLNVRSNGLGYMRIFKNLEEYKKVNLRYVIIPSVETYDFGDVDNADIQFDIQLGYDDTKKLINMTQSQRMDYVRSQLGTIDTYLI